MAIEEKAGFCTLCRSRCGTINVVEDGKLVAVRPNPQHPTGKAICAKGRAAPEIAQTARRIETPLRRTAPKGAADPGFMPISWDEALAEIAARFAQIRAESGPEAVAFAVTSGSSSSMSDSLDWVQRFIRGFGSPNTVFSTEICNWHKDHAHAFTFGCGIPTADYRNAELIMLWGHNPANVWLAQAEAIGAARAAGAKVVAIDPRKAGSSGNADLWLQIRPGTDGVLAMAAARHLIRSGTFDRDFVAGFSNGPLLVRDDNGHFLRGRDLGWQETPDAYVLLRDGQPQTASLGVDGAVQLEATAGIEGPHGLLPCRTAFDRYAEAVEPYDFRTAAEITGIPATQIELFATWLGQAQSIAYHCWTGVGQHTNATQTERAIATLYALTGSFDRRGGNVRMPGQPVPSLHSMAMIPPETRAKALGLGERPLGPPADGWITSTSFYDAILENKPYGIRALMGFGSNLLISHPAEARGRQALQALEFQVHCDLFLNPTAAYADIVLPVSSAWENEALRIGFEISLEAQELVQLRQPIIAPTGQGRSDMWIVFQLAKRLGMNELFFDGNVVAGFNYLLAPLGLTAEALREQPEGVRRPLKLAYEKYRSQGFATETGRAELYSELFLRHGQPPVPTYVPAAGAPTEKYPLMLFSANNGYFCHSQHRGIVSLRRRRPEPLAALHPETARARGIGEGDLIRIATSTGEVELTATLDASLTPEMVASDYGWWQPAPDLGLPGYQSVGAKPGANFNALISEDLRDPISGALPLRSSRCEIRLSRRHSDTDWRQLQVIRRRNEPGDVAYLELAEPDGDVLPGFVAGQFITLEIEGHQRSYSLVGPAEEMPHRYCLGIRKADEGFVSAMIFDRVAVGTEILVKPPTGSFVIPQSNEFPIVLIAGGIGITPFLSYLDSLTGSADEPEVWLHYATRDASSRPFMDVLERRVAALPRLHVIHHLSRPNASYPHRGRFTANDIPDALLARRPRFYMCASDSMMDVVATDLRHRSVPAFEIFRERFVSPRPFSTAGLKPRRITFARSGRTETWLPEAGSLLAFAEAAGLSIPSGCRVGQCESCAVRIIEGQVGYATEVPMLEEDTCLTCMAVPHTDLVLEA